MSSGTEPLDTDAEAAKGVTNGTIQNTKGDTPYTGPVRLTVNRLIGMASDRQRMSLFTGEQAAKPLDRENSNNMGIQITLPGRIYVLCYTG